MAIPNADRGAIEQALKAFDDTLRESDEWARWESNKAQTYALQWEGRRYPPKKVVSMAAGVPVGDFSGGPETNDVLSRLGFDVLRLREPSLFDTFSLILEKYGTARATQRFGGNHEIRELFAQARQILQTDDEVKSRAHIHVVSSYGKGRWATIPWISLLDDRETRTTQDGTYVVYLFREDGKGFYVKLAQGVTRLEKEMGARAADVLALHAAEVRAQLSGLAEKGFDLSGKSDLGSSQRLARLYEASTIAARYYPIDVPVNDQQLKADLAVLLDSYERYVESRAVGGELAKDTRKLSLIGTWRGARHKIDTVRQAIEAKGAWASPWSFPIRKEALARLETPFFLYAYEGNRRITARLRVDEIKTSNGQTGIISPWPEATNPEWTGVTRSGEKQSHVFKTWLKIGRIDVLEPPLSLEDFELALGLSDETNILNQNTFGYVIEDEEQTDAEDATVPEPMPLAPALGIDWLVSKTGLRQEFLEELVDALLGSSPQVMLAGPPGTSKTFLAQALALYVARNRASHIRLVQFHPSYSYESFIEGLRPVSNANGVSFALTPGIVREVVGDMQRMGAVNTDGNEFVVILDEANRANLPRVLGELMYLFEYRGESIRLQYSGDFALPKNLRFIATMNTADRSIRSIDVALRRRFDVFELNPDAELLASHYEATATSSVPDLVDGFIALNVALESGLDRHHTIGHAFFMRPTMTPKVLAQIWGRKIFPLIEEFYFDQPDLTKTFSVGRFWPSAGG